MILDPTQVSSLRAQIESGVTLVELAVQEARSLSDMAFILRRNNLPLPSTGAHSTDMFSNDLRLRIHNSDNLKDILEWPDGTVCGYPDALWQGRFDAKKIYEAFHTGNASYVDSYTGITIQEHERATSMRVILTVPSQRGMMPRTVLISNFEMMTDSTVASRFDNSEPISEKFSFASDDFGMDLTITKPYDKMVGGTYNPTYLEKMFQHWIANPYKVASAADDYDFTNIHQYSLFEFAVWSFIQLTHFGLLKGLTELTVRKNGKELTVTDFSIQGVLSEYAEQKGLRSAPLIQTATEMPRPQVQQMPRAPSALLGSYANRG